MSSSHAGAATLPDAGVVPNEPRTVDVQDSSPAAPTSAAPILAAVVVVGQVPPPMNGQALMISEFLKGAYPGLHIEHVPMEFSRSTAEIGSFGIRKLGLLLTTLVNILRAVLRARKRASRTILYYPPAGANLVPVMRDLVLLIPTRWLFDRTVFHFHAAGLYEIYPRLPALLRPLFRLAYGRPDLAIFTTRLTSAEAAPLNARETAIVPCGVRDHSSTDRSDRSGGAATRRVAALPKTLTILYAGILCEGKGLLTLVEACSILHARGLDFRLVCMGAFQPAEFQQQLQSTIRAAGLQDHVSFPGVLTGEDKTEAFASADIFCFPSHYPAESFGVVLIEAMSFSLPIVASEWQGIPEVIGASKGAYLVPVKEPAALAGALEKLLESPEVRLRMGRMNRQRYLESFTLATYRENLHRSLLKVARSA